MATVPPPALVRYPLSSTHQFSTNHYDKVTDDDICYCTPEARWKLFIWVIRGVGDEEFKRRLHVANKLKNDWQRGIG